MTELTVQPLLELCAATFPSLVASLEDYAKTLYTEFEPTSGLLVFGLWWSDEEFARRYPVFDANGVPQPGQKRPPVPRPQLAAGANAQAISLYKVKDERYRAYSAAVAKFYAFLDARLPRHVKVDICHHYNINFTAYASLTWAQKVDYLKAEYNSFRADDVRQLMALIPKVIPSTQSFASMSAEMFERFDQLEQAGCRIAPLEQMIKLEDACAGLESASRAITLYKDSTEATAEQRTFGAMRKAILKHLRNGPSITAQDAGFTAHVVASSTAGLTAATAHTQSSAAGSTPVTLESLANNVNQLTKVMTTLIQQRDSTAVAFNTRKRTRAEETDRSINDGGETAPNNFCYFHGPCYHSTKECYEIAKLPTDSRNHYLSLPTPSSETQQAVAKMMRSTNNGGGRGGGRGMRQKGRGGGRRQQHAMGNRSAPSSA